MLSAEPNALTYFVQEGLTRQPIPARFLPLTAADAEEIQEETWHGVFFPIWRQIVEIEALRERACKLVCEEGSDKRIQGLLFLGIAPGANWSLDCLLEAAPWNQHENKERRYCGVGKALVARVIAEHWHRGLRTPIQIESSPRSQTFYQRLGFFPPKKAPKANRFFLTEEAAKTIFESVTGLRV